MNPLSQSVREPSPTRPSNSRWNALVAIGVAVVLCGCVDIDKLREAQSTFNEAATAEDQSRLAAYTKGSNADVGTLSARASIGYAKTIAILTGLSDKDKTQLSADKLLGSAQTIEALSRWRLRDYDGALKVATAIKSDTLYPRDLALITALPGLIEISEAYDKIYLPDPHPDPTRQDPGKKECLFGGDADGVKNFDKIDGLLSDAIRDIDKAMSQVTPTDPVTGYLLQAQLSAYKNKTDALAYACKTAGLAPTKKKLSDVELKAAKATLEKFYCGSQTNPTQPVANPQAEFWSTIIGLPLPATCALH
jgi:hypothetical protein